MSWVIELHIVLLFLSDALFIPVHIGLAILISFFSVILVVVGVLLICGYFRKTGNCCNKGGII